MNTRPLDRSQSGSIESAAETLTRAFSRALFRRLVPALPECDASQSPQRVLDACEMTTQRLLAEPNFARPARFLFEEIRHEFPIGDQLWVRRTIELHVDFARQLIEQLPESPRECGACTRAGDPCRRHASRGSEFCPSHRHLELMDGRAG